MASQTVQVLIADDHDGVRQGIRFLIGPHPQFEVVGEADNGKEAVRLTKKLRPDILILDVKLPGLSGQDVARAVQDLDTPTKVLALSSYDNAEYILTMFDLGVRGYLTKDEAPSLLVRALNEIWRGADRWLSAALTRKTGISPQPTPIRDLSLTQREIEIIRLLKAGKTEQQIADELGLSVHRTRRFIRVLIAKHGVRTVDELKNA